MYLADSCLAPNLVGLFPRIRRLPCARVPDLPFFALHAAVIGAVFLSKTERPELLEPEAVMVSIIEAPPGAS